MNFEESFASKANMSNQNDRNSQYITLEPPSKELLKKLKKYPDIRRLLIDLYFNFYDCMVDDPMGPGFVRGLTEQVLSARAIGDTRFKNRADRLRKLAENVDMSRSAYFMLHDYLEALGKRRASLIQTLVNKLGAEMRALNSRREN